MSELICTSELDSSFPLALGTMYVGRSKGRYPWLRREGPRGHRGRHLWIDAKQFNEWAAERGLKFRFLAAGSKDVEAQH